MNHESGIYPEDEEETEEEQRAKKKYIEKMLRKYERELWAIIGMKEHNFEY